MDRSQLNRRSFVACGIALGATPVGIARSADGGPGSGTERASAAERIRREAAARQRMTLPKPDHRPNGDERRHPDGMASFAKCLPHDERGHVDPAAYAALVAAIESGDPARFEAIRMGGAGKLKHPQAGAAFDLQGPDSHALGLAAPPPFASAETAAEMVELYWQALTRDVAYDDYASNPLIAAACAELSRLASFTGPRENGLVAASTVFRGPTRGDLAGPYVSQFLVKDVPFGAMTVKQQIRTTAPGIEFMTGYRDWLACQSGSESGSDVFDRELRYIRNARDLGEYVHRDYPSQPYMNAALVLLGMKAPFDRRNPYVRSTTQTGELLFGPPAILDVVARVMSNSTKTAWYHKWSLHRRLRPEEYAGRVENHLTGAASYPLHEQVLNARATQRIRERHGTHLLPQAYPEGCPAHPAYPAGHAVNAGAGVTILKAFFEEDWVIPEPVVSAPDGRSLRPWRGASLTVGDELDKLAGNIAMGRDAAGVHFRSDCVEGMKLGEAVALNYLAEMRALCNERFEGFSVTRFDGTRVTV